MSATLGDLPFDRTPPFSVEAETAVVAAVLMSPSAVTEALAAVRESDFYYERNRRIFRAAVDLWERGTSVDVITVGESLKAAGELDMAGGYDYLSQLIEAVPTAANVGYHARIVREKATMRRVITEATALIREVYAVNGDGIGAVAAAVERVTRSLDGYDASDFRQAKDRLWPTFEMIEELQRRGAEGSLGLSSGFYDVDRMTAGLQPGELSILAARPSQGKTAWAMDVVRHLALRSGTPCGIASLEMTTEALIMRALCAEARVDLQRLRRGELDAEENQRLTDAAGRVDTAPIYIDDEPVAGVAQLRAKTSRLSQRTGARLLVVDYLQLMEGSGEDSRRLEVEAATRGLKHLARKLNIHVLLLSQLSRAPENRPNHRPLLSDLRESGSIEQDADLVMFLYRPETYIQDGDSKESKAKANEARERLKGVTELIIAKQRNGPTGTVGLYFTKEHTRFESIARGGPESAT